MGGLRRYLLSFLSHSTDVLHRRRVSWVLPFPDVFPRVAAAKSSRFFLSRSLSASQINSPTVTILTCKLQTDQLEAKFGKYRQLAIITFLFSKCLGVKKLRNMSISTLPLCNQNGNLISFEKTLWAKMENNGLVHLHKFDLEVTKDNFEKCIDLLQVLTFLLVTVALL